MDTSLNDELRQWLGRFALHWAIPFGDIPRYLGKIEIENRLAFYPALRQAVTRTPVNLTEVRKAAEPCWVLGEQHDVIRFSKFCSKADSAEAIVSLVQDFPTDDGQAGERIDAFIERCSMLGYEDPKSGNLNASSAALLCSTILTIAYPKRFVDFRQTRWKELAEELEYNLFTKDTPTYGEMIVVAGRFAQAVCDTITFTELWPEGEPLWVLAGVCYHANSESGAETPKEPPIYPYEEDFEEGAMSLRQHVIRERSSTVVRKAKELWRAADFMLRCDVCRFSFVEKYGELGEDYIEAHHTQPIHALKAGAKTKATDLSKVCANCHRMLHLNNEVHTLDELRAILTMP